MTTGAAAQAGTAGGANGAQGGGEGKPPEGQGTPPQDTGFRWTSLDPALGTEKTLEKFKGKDEREVLGQLARAYTGLEKLQGGMIRIPKEDAKPEEWAEFNKKIGVPETYSSAKELQVVPEGMEWDDQIEQNFSNFAKSIGLTAKQHKAVLERYIQTTQQLQDRSAESHAESVRESMAKLEQAWGANLKRNVALAVRTTQSFDDAQGSFKALLETELPGIGKLGNHPAYLAWAAKVGASMLEANFINGEDLTTSSADAAKELADIMKNPDYLSKDKNPAEHDRLVARTHQLRQIMEGVV